MKRCKTIIKVINYISLGAILPTLAILPLYIGKDRRNEFLFFCLLAILMLFLLPLVFRSLSLFNMKDKIPPDIWLIAYSVIVVLYVVILFSTGFSQYIRDFPSAVKEKFISIEGEAHILKVSNAKVSIRVQDVEFVLDDKSFNPIRSNITYKIIFLQNSKYVINVIDDEGHSMLKG